MRKSLLIASAAAMLAVPAFAADLPRRTQPVASAPIIVPPAFSWTGFYLGANAGWQWTDTNQSVSYSAAEGTGPSFGGEKDGFTAGATLGYNMQFDQFVVGLEGDWNWVDVSRSGSGVTSIGGTAVSGSSSTDWLATARARFGVAFDRFLVYGTGGFAFANVDSTVTFGGVTTGDDDMRWGWTLGGGVEYSLMNNWSAKVEYLYYQLEKKNYSLALGGGSFRSEPEGSIVRAGLNYRF